MNDLLPGRAEWLAEEGIQPYIKVCFSRDASKCCRIVALGDLIWANMLQGLSGYRKWMDFIRAD